MPKRTVASASSTPRKKTRNASASQSSLDTFFRAVPQRSNTTEQSPSKGKAKASHIELPDSADAAGADSEGLLASDEAYARLLALQDGLDLETLSNMENEGAATRRKKSDATQSSRVGHAEVIDVDLLDDDGQQIPPRDSSELHLVQEKDVELVSPRNKTPTTSFNSGKRVTAFQPTFTSTNSPDGTATYPSLAVDPSVYPLDPSLWPIGAPIPYSFLAHTLSTLSETKSRILILNILTNALRTISKHHPASLLPALYLLSNSLSPPYSPLELGLGPSIISKAIQHVSGLTSAALKRLYNATGDAGDVAFEAKSNVRTLIPHPPLLITGVYESLLKIANAKGQGAARQKQAIVEKLLVSAKGEEIRFLVRTLGQNLRVGAVRTSILTALARAMVLTPPTHLNTPIPQDSPFRVPPDLILRSKPLPASETKKKIVDHAKDELHDIFHKAEALIKKVYVQHPNYDHITQALLEAGLEGLAERLPLTVGVPLLPTLGSPTRSLDEIYDRLGFLPFTAEFKYDGQRAQIHATRNGIASAQISINIFSRHLEDMTEKYPDVISLVESIFNTSPQTVSFILDAEIVAIDTNDGSLRSFQELSNRARRDVKIDDVRVSVCVFAFDIMYMDGEILLEKPFRERRAILRSRFPPLIPDQKGAARFDHVQSRESEDGREAIEEFWQAAVNSRSEGLMIKLLDSGEVLETLEETSVKKPKKKPLPATYEPDKRTSAWLKLKKDYVTGLGDSLDLVPIGAWHGNGRKANWWSPILLALWDPEAGKLVAVCKCMSGFSDIFYKALQERYPENSDTCSHQLLWEPECDTGGLKPEVYFKPQEVWEIRGADVTLSPVSVAALGLVSKTRGLSLRFPRFMKVREDKGIENASTPEFLAKMYTDQQGQGKNHTGVDDGELLDVEVEEAGVDEDFSSEE